MERLDKIVFIGDNINIENFGGDKEGLTPISMIEGYVESLKKRGATHLGFITTNGWDGCEPDIEFTGAKIEIETDQEYKIRMNKEKLAEEDLVNREKEYYLKLKVKYGE